MSIHRIDAVYNRIGIPKERDVRDKEITKSVGDLLAPAESWLGGGGGGRRGGSGMEYEPLRHDPHVLDVRREHVPEMAGLRVTPGFVLTTEAHPLPRLEKGDVCSLTAYSEWKSS